jgi:hypothetical protein
MSNMEPDTINTTIVLSDDDIREAEEIANRRIKGCRDRGLRDKHGAEPHNNLKYNLLGVKGEIAFRKFLGSTEEITVNTFRSQADISGFEVRTSSGDGWDLIIRRDDSDSKIYVLVTGNDRKFKIRGWLRGSERYSFEYKTINTRPKAWFVPQSKLHKISSLPNLNLTKKG